MNTNRPFDCRNLQPLALTRRDMLKSVSAGFGYLAFAGLSAQAAGTYQSPSLPKAPHFPARAKRIIFLAMQGGPSHLDTFDYKPKLATDAGKAGDKGRLVAPVAEFKQRGQSGLWISDAFPQVAQHADELCLLRGMHTDIPNHPQAFVQLHTGSARFVRPSLGAWTLYGLGTENQNLPGYLTIAAPIALGGAQNYGSAFLPASYQGTRMDAPAGAGPVDKKARKNDTGTNQGIGNIRANLSADSQRAQLDLVQSMNRDLLATTGANPEVEGIIESYELAFRMQSEVPKVMDMSKESAATLKAYGVGQGNTDNFGKQCLMARRLAEAGVRFIEVCHQGWDHHSGLKSRIAGSCSAVDQPIAALLADLKQRDMLKDTLVIWGGEFGRTPGNGSADGRGHNAKGYSMWLAGGGVKPGFSYGSTDEHGAKAVGDKMHVHDLHATVLHLLGLDHEKLTYRYAGRDFRLTDVYGQVPKAILV